MKTHRKTLIVFRQHKAVLSKFETVSSLSGILAGWLAQWCFRNLNVTVVAAAAAAGNVHFEFIKKSTVILSCNIAFR